MESCTFVYSSESPAAEMCEPTWFLIFMTLTMIAAYYWFKKPEENCIICLEQLDERTFKVKRCGHEFHHRCFKRWNETQVLGPSCPMCRTFI